MDGPIVLECTISTALQQLYDPLSSPRVRRRADAFLQEFQCSPEGAETSLTILKKPFYDTENAEHNTLLQAKRAFLASTIYKMVTSFSWKCKVDDVASLTLEDRALYEPFVHKLGRMAQDVWGVLTGPDGAPEDLNVQTYLALTIAVILLRVHDPLDDRTIVNDVEWFVQNQVHHSVDTTRKMHFAVLLTLKVIPEEVDNSRVKLSKAKRAQCKDMVQQCAPHVVHTVLPSIAAAMDASGKHAQWRSLLFQAFSTWVEHGMVQPEVLIESGLLDRCFREMLVPSTSVDALQGIREVVRVCRHNEHVQLMELVMHNFVVLGKHVQEHIAGSKPSTEMCLVNCARSISDCGQAFIMYFVDYTLDMRPGSLVYEFLDAIMFFTSLNNLNVSNETMDFWVQFRIYVSGKHKQRMCVFESFISRLLAILIDRTQYPEGFEFFPETAKERFHVYRSEVRNVFRALATVSTASEDLFIVDTIHAIFRQYEAAESRAPLPPNVHTSTQFRCFANRTNLFIMFLFLVMFSGGKLRKYMSTLLVHYQNRFARKTHCLCQDYLNACRERSRLTVNSHAQLSSSLVWQATGLRDILSTCQLTLLTLFPMALSILRTILDVCQVRTTWKIM